MLKNKLNTDLLKNEIVNLANKYSKDENVECIYFLPFAENDERIFDLVIVFSEQVNLDSIDKEISELNEKYCKKIFEIGGKIVLLSDRSDKYSAVAMHYYEVRRVRDLLSSSILFDRSGEYVKIAHQFDEYNTMNKYDNILEVNIDTKINNARQLQFK